MDPKKVDRAIRLLRSIPSDDIELAFSGGKDSSVILKLAQMVRLYIKNGLVWWNKKRKKEIASKKNFGTIYDLFFHNVFCKSYNDYLQKKHTLFGDLDYKKFLEDYFKIKL